jgi:hypothetical protein
MPEKKRKKLRCIDPEVGRRVFLQIGERAPCQEIVLLSGELENHIKMCPHCSEYAPQWILKAGGGIVARAGKIVSEAREANSAVLHKRQGQLDVYFKPNAPGSADGLMVRAGSGEEIVSVHETTVDIFEGLSA